MSMRADEIVFTPFTHDEMVAGVQAIAASLEAEHWRPSLLVGVGRGGLTPAVFLSHRLGLPLVSIDHSTRIVPSSAKAPCLTALVASSCSAMPSAWAAAGIRRSDGPATTTRRSRSATKGASCERTRCGVWVPVHTVTRPCSIWANATWGSMGTC